MSEGDVFILFYRQSCKIESNDTFKGQRDMRTCGKNTEHKSDLPQVRFLFGLRDIQNLLIGGSGGMLGPATKPKISPNLYHPCRRAGGR